MRNAVTDEAFFRPLPKELFSYQREACQWLDKYGSGILALDMGLGKTLASLAVADVPAIVVCPASLKQNWARECQRWRPELSIAVVGIDKFPNLSADLIIVNYEQLKGELLEKMIKRRNVTLIVDEAHYLKDLRVYSRIDRMTNRWVQRATGSKRAQHVWWLARHCDRRILLTGTPMINGRHSELFPLLHIVDPNVWRAFPQFSKRYCPAQSKFVGRMISDYSRNANSSELHNLVDDVYMFRRTKEELSHLLPEKQRFTKVVMLPQKVADEYTLARTQFLQWVEDKGGAAAAMRAASAIAITKLTALRKVAAVGKAQIVAEDAIQHVLSTGSPLVVMGHHREALDGVLDEIASYNANAGQKIRCGTITGTDSVKARQEAVDAFQRGDVDVLVCSIAAAGVGLTLTRGQTMFFVERLWRPFDNLQAEDRIHRVGQKNQCQITYYEAYMTIDSYIADLTQDKAKAANVVVEGVEMTETQAVELIYGRLLDDASAPDAPALE